MEPAVVAALITATVSFVALVVSNVMTGRREREVAKLEADEKRRAAAEQRDTEAEEIVAKYREPLVTAALDLQSRLYNILEQEFLEGYVFSGSDRRDTALKTTLFRLAQYFGWVEILREEIQFLKFSKSRTLAPWPRCWPTSARSSSPTSSTTSGSCSGATSKGRSASS